MTARHSRAPIAWTPQMLAYLSAHYADDSNASIGAAIGVSGQSVMRKALELRLRKNLSPTAAARAEEARLKREAAEAEARRIAAQSIVTTALAARLPIEVAVQQWRCAA